MYLEGFGMPHSESKANEWFLKAYAQEEPHSCYDLYLLTDS